MWDGAVRTTAIESINASTAPIPAIRSVSLTLLRLKTANPQRNTSNSNGERISKYIQPYENVRLNRHARIPAERNIATPLFPFAYQQRTAKNGDITVKPPHIIA